MNPKILSAFFDLRRTLELMTEQHDVSRFDCQNTYLNDFLKNKAFDETKKDLSRTYVFCDRSLPPAEAVLGYFTLRADSIMFPRENGQGSQLLPVVELMCLARHIKNRGESVGDALLINAFALAVEAANVIGIAGMHLAFTNEGKRLYDRYGFGPHPHGENSLLISIREIRAALEIPD